MQSAFLKGFTDKQQKPYSMPKGTKFERGKYIMYFKKNCEEVINGLRADLAEAEACLSAWEKVSVLRKKDGSEYAQLGKALDGAKLIKDGLVADSDHPYIRVNYKCGNKYLYDEFWGFHYLDELPDSDPRKAPYRRQFVRQTCPMTAEEVREAIAKRVEVRRQDVAERKADISAAESAYMAFRETMHKAEEELKAAGSFHLFCTIKEAVSF
jgi:hypothetical protein